MPSVRLYLTPEIVDRLDPEVQIDLTDALRAEVASTFKVDYGHVEVLWIGTDLGVNTAPIMIDVMYSVRPDLQPDKATRTRLAQNLSSMTLQFEGMIEDVTEVATWVLPQHDVVFATAKME